MRRRMVKPAEMQAIAQQLGRRPVNRGKEPNWESEVFEHLPPLSIPDHGGGRDLHKFVRGKCIVELLRDVEAWDACLGEDENGNDHV